VFLLTVRNRPWTQIRRASPPVLDGSVIAGPAVGAAWSGDYERRIIS